MYFYSEWLLFGLCIVCDWLQVAYSFSFWLGHGKRNYSLLPCSPLFSAASPRDQLQSQHCVTVSSCDRLAYFWKSVPTLSLLEKKSKLSLKINPFGRGGESFRRHSALGLQFCWWCAQLCHGLGELCTWPGTDHLPSSSAKASVLHARGSRLKCSMELHGCCPVMSYISHIPELLLQTQKYYCLFPRNRNRSSEFGT